MQDISNMSSTDRNMNFVAADSRICSNECNANETCATAYCKQTTDSNTLMISTLTVGLPSALGNHRIDIAGSTTSWTSGYNENTNVCNSSDSSPFVGQLQEAVDEGCSGYSLYNYRLQKQHQRLSPTYDVSVGPYDVFPFCGVSSTTVSTTRSCTSVINTVQERSTSGLTTPHSISCPLTGDIANFSEIDQDVDIDDFRFDLTDLERYDVSTSGLGDDCVFMSGFSEDLNLSETTTSQTDRVKSTTKTRDQQCLSQPCYYYQPNHRHPSMLDRRFTYPFIYRKNDRINQICKSPATWVKPELKSPFTNNTDNTQFSYSFSKYDGKGSQTDSGEHNDAYTGTIRLDALACGCSEQTPSVVPDSRRRHQSFTMPSSSTRCRSTGSSTSFELMSETEAPVDAENSDDVMRRKRRREQNRRAARKCREKKKDNVDSMRMAYDKTRAENERLLVEKNNLKSLVVSLQDLMQAHQAVCKMPLSHSACVPSPPSSSTSLQSSGRMASGGFTSDIDADFLSTCEIVFN